MSAKEKTKDEIRVGDRKVALSNPDKELFPDDGITKAELIDYYRTVARPMLSHLKDRPLGMERYPDGHLGKSFFHKDVPDYFPDWIRTVPVPKESGSLTMAVCDDVFVLTFPLGARPTRHDHSLNGCRGTLLALCGAEAEPRTHVLRPGHLHHLSSCRAPRRSVSTTRRNCRYRWSHGRRHSVVGTRARPSMADSSTAAQKSHDARLSLSGGAGLPVGEVHSRRRWFRESGLSV
ncbi:hypothetical protein ABZ656_11070 [Streptomyces sp. NPDC007095]|uniref:non-homologous end-joining DNA ligase LigD n=1 Tax=Streptomyces sp. NPDC007095 TaxID=3154482 RepID=UPI003407EC4A